MTFTHPRFVPGLSALIATGMIAGAWFFELVVKLAPCPLCLQQRWPWYAAIAVGGIGFAFAGNGKARFLALICLALLMLASAGLAIYHSGVEWDFWQGPTGCSAAQAMPQTAGDLLGALQETRVPSCKEAAWRFLGLSLAGWNALGSLGVFVLTAAALRAGRSSRNHAG
jgi:disulfide bond formation protein DsbB